VPVASVVDCPRLGIGLAVSIETWPELPGVANAGAVHTKRVRAAPALASDPLRTPGLYRANDFGSRRISPPVLQMPPGSPSVQL